MTIGPHRVFHSLYTVSVQNQTQNTFHQPSPPPLARTQQMNFTNPHPLRPPPPNHAQNPRTLQPGQFPRNPNMSSQAQPTHPAFVRLPGPRIKRTYMKRKQPESSPPFSAGSGTSTNSQSQPYVNGSSDQMKTFVTTNNNSAIETFEIIELPDENQDDINSLPEYIPLEPESILGDTLSSTPRISNVNSIRNLENFVGTDLQTEDLMMDLFRASPSPPLFTSFTSTLEEEMKPPKPKKPKPKRRKVHTPKEGFREKCVVCGVCTPGNYHLSFLLLPTFHGFSIILDRNYYPVPADTDRRLRWLELINIADIRIPEKSVICDEHFIDTNFQYYPDMKRNLKKKAIPTVTDNEKEISRMRHLALNAGIIKDCSIVLMVQKIKLE